MSDGNLDQLERLIRAADPEHPRAGYVPYWG
jgi:hypothetical protein